MDVKPLADIADKYVRVTSGRAQDYVAGVSRTPPDKWATRASGAAAAWNAGVQQAAAENRFAAGIDGKGPKWQRKARDVGGQRFGPGVSAAKDDYSAGFGRYADVLRSITLDPRGPRGDPRNINRVAVIATALNAARRAAKRA